MHYDVHSQAGWCFTKVRSQRCVPVKETLVATLGYLNAPSGLMRHLVTVNDYSLVAAGGWASCTAGWVYRPGLSPRTSAMRRRAAYHADITYGTTTSLASTTCATT